MSTEPDDRYIVPAVDRALRLLSLLAAERGELTLAELTARLALPHATMFRLAHTLERHGLVRRSLTGYQIGPRILTLGFDYLATQDLSVLARPELVALRDATGASANLAVLDGQDVIYICHVPSLRPLGSRVQVGSRLPAHASSIGRVLLGALPEDALRALYRDPADAFPDTAHDADALVAQAARDRARGWVRKRGVYERELMAIAAPVLDAGGAIVAAINISGPARLVAADDDGVAQAARVMHSARVISGLLGWRGATPPTQSQNL